MTLRQRIWGHSTSIDPATAGVALRALPCYSYRLSEEPPDIAALRKSSLRPPTVVWRRPYASRCQL